jgi:hypothetical protein
VKAKICLKVLYFFVAVFQYLAIFPEIDAQKNDNLNDNQTIIKYSQNLFRKGTGPKSMYQMSIRLWGPETPAASLLKLRKIFDKPEPSEDQVSHVLCK